MEAAIQTMKFYEKKFRPLAKISEVDLSPQQRHSKIVYRNRLGRIYNFITENLRPGKEKRIMSKC